MTLEPQQEELLELLVEASRVPGSQGRQPIYAYQPVGAGRLMLRHPGVPTGRDDVYEGDLEELARLDLVRVRVGNRTWTIDVTNEGRAYYAQLHGRTTTPFPAVAALPTTYVETQAFIGRHQEAATKCRQAVALLWSAEAQAELTAIGHHAREALQAFSTSSLALKPSPGAPSEPTKSVARLRAVVTQRADLSPAVRAYLDALLVTFGTASDLAQRQEHGASKEGEALTWEDARRLVVALVTVLYELDRALFA